MKTNINLELFKRYAPKKKLEIIESLTQEELLAITTASITRIVREVGNKKSKEYKTFRVRDEFRAYNFWNVYFIGIDLIKGKPWLFFCIDNSNTGNEDCPICDGFIKIKSPTYYSSYMESIQNCSDFYDNNARARAIKSLLLEYVYTKYADKLNPKNG